MSLPSNPFPGPVPFKDTDPIFGRDREIGELVDRLVADRLVLLYSPSGAGKSSMLNAAGGVLPRMREREFRTHKTIRVGLEAPAGVNRYVWSCATSLEVAHSAPQRLTEVLGEAADDLFIFDQFEEVLTADPGDRAGQRLEFFKQLGEAMRVHGRWAVFAIREDYLAPIDDYFEWIPTQLASRMRINILAAKEARQAILRPIEQSNAAVTFEDGALDDLLSDLAPDGWVEPVQLQVVCKDLWEELRKQNLSVISKKLLSTSGSAEVALERYYNRVVSDVAAGLVARKLEVTERNIRDWFGDGLISGGTRMQLLKGETHTGTLPNEVVEELDHAHLIRGDTRRNKTWCELTHDRLIRPVTRSNDEWKKDPNHLSVLQRETELWVKGGSSPDRLLRGKALRQSVKWARQHAKEANAAEKEYLRRSVGARRRRRILVGAVMVFVALLFSAADKARRAGQESHLELVKAISREAAHASVDQPDEATRYALEAYQRHIQGDFMGSIFDFGIGRRMRAAEEVAVRGAMFAATVQHDPRYARFAWFSQQGHDRPCVWFSDDGRIIWVLNRPDGPDGPISPSAFDSSTLSLIYPTPRPAPGCPAQFIEVRGAGIDPSGEPTMRFQGPVGWSAFRRADRIEFHAPKGHSPSVYTGRPASSVLTAVVDPTGRRAAWTMGSSFYVLDFASKRIVLSAETTALALCFSPDGNILAAGAEDSRIQLWWFDPKDSVAITSDLPMRAHTNSVEDLAFSPDGRQLVSEGPDGRIVLWKIRRELAPGWDGLTADFVPGFRLVTTVMNAAGIDEDILEVRSLDGSNSEANPPRKFPLPKTPGKIVMRRDGRKAALILAGENEIGWFQVIDLETGKLTDAFRGTGDVRELALSDDGRTIAAAGVLPKIAVYSLAGDVPKLSFTLDCPDRPSAMAFLPDGHTLIVASSSHQVHYFDLKTRVEIPSTDKHFVQRGRPVAIAISPDGKLGAMLDEEDMMRFFDVDAHQIVGGALKIPGAFQSMAFGLDGKSFHVLLARGQSISWPIDMPRMLAEAKRLAGK